MKTKTMYVADDGTPFNSMQECVAYEKSVNKYKVFYEVKTARNIVSSNTVSKEFENEPLAKRFIANLLHDSFEAGTSVSIKLVHCGAVVQFYSDELKEAVPARYKINGEKLNEVFRKAKMRNPYLG